MREVCGREARTIHSLFRVSPVEQRLGDPCPVDIAPGTLVIVDETSMLDLKLLSKVVKATKHLNLHFLFVGDPCQLPPVNYGDVFKGLVEWAEAEDAILRLTKVHRQAEGNPILKLARSIRDGSELDLDGAAARASSGERVVFAEALGEVAAIAEAAKHAPAAGDEFKSQILASTNSICNALNNRITGRAKNSKLAPGDFVVSKQNTADFLGTKPILVQGAKTGSYFESLLLRNGGKKVRGTIAVSHSAKRGVNGTTGYYVDNSVLVNEAGLIHAKNPALAYAMTVHSSQGSEWDKVVVVLPPAIHDGLEGYCNRESLYTAITRAKKELVIIGSARVLAWILATPAPARHSMSYLRR
jgi:exodeoxyribonuclease V alpha subunit